jgi:hypothetical protein
MKIWTYLEAKNKLEIDHDLEDETFVQGNELIGYFNDALNEAESEIITINEDYLKSKFYLPLVQGTAVYSLPINIYANKIRKIMYSAGSIIYEVVRYRGVTKFTDMSFTDQFGQADDYRYDLINDNPGQAQIELHPASRETAILSQGTLSVPMIMSYIRNCARIPITGEFCNHEVVYPSQVSGNVITHNSGTTNYGIVARGVAGSFPGSIAYVTGDQVKLSVKQSGGTLPTGLTAETTYYVIALSPTTISLASSLANALGNVPIALTGSGTIYFTIRVAATLAIQNATLIDIPEFMPFLMAWVKAAVLFKEKDPGFQDASTILLAQKKQMVDTLTNSVPDDDDKIMGDFTHYEEMS